MENIQYLITHPVLNFSNRLRDFVESREKVRKVLLEKKTTTEISSPDIHTQRNEKTAVVSRVTRRPCVLNFPLRMFKNIFRILNSFVFCIKFSKFYNVFRSFAKLNIQDIIGKEKKHIINIYTNTKDKKCTLSNKFEHLQKYK